MTTARQSSQSRRAAKPRRRKSKNKVRLRYDRILLVVGIVALVIISVSATLKYCSGDSSPVIESGLTVPQAAQSGQRDAAKAESTAPGSMERQQVLLEIKTRESALRAKGYNRAADDYIKAANDYLKAHNLLD